MIRCKRIKITSEKWLQTFWGNYMCNRFHWLQWRFYPGGTQRFWDATLRAHPKMWHFNNFHAEMQHFMAYCEMWLQFKAQFEVWQFRVYSEILHFWARSEMCCLRAYSEMHHFYGLFWDVILWDTFQVVAFRVYFKMWPLRLFPYLAC